ncbi:hypothetical protein [Gordonia sp. (in: high G+C Gram-positive bacteria)]|uniref:hypothetical protein n=1 Tax=Gordonia sp. (in: high G+C Gram-positive bacteria) TaxID=84139 RepID=UPI003C717D88
MTSTMTDTKKARVRTAKHITQATTSTNQQGEEAMSQHTRLIDRCGVDLIDSIHGYYWDDIFGEYMVKVDLIDSNGRIHRGCISAADLMIAPAEEADDDEEEEPVVFHRFKRGDVAFSRQTGTPIPAACGQWVVSDALASIAVKLGLRPVVLCKPCRNRR